MASYISVQRAIDRGRGIAARVLGQPYSVYRLGANAAAGHIDPLNLIRTNFPVLRHRLSVREDVEAPERTGTLFFEIVGDMSHFLVGDVFVQTDTVYGPGATAVVGASNQFNGFALAFHGPVRKSVGARLDRVVQVYRPNTEPDTSGYWQSTLGNARPLVLTNGIYAFGAVGDVAAELPVGFQFNWTTKQRNFHELPGDVGTQGWYCYVPPLPDGGPATFSFREGDRIVDTDGARYAVRHPYRQEAGFVGSTLILEREIGQ